MMRKAVIVVLTLATLATAVAWIVTVKWRYCHCNRQSLITVCGGGISVSRFSLPVQAVLPMMPVEGWSRRPDYPLVPPSNIGWPRYQATLGTYVYVPYWLLIALFAPYPAAAFVCGPLRRFRRCDRGLCSTCGYNLTGNESGQCPECGTEIKRA